MNNARKTWRNKYNREIQNMNIRCEHINSNSEIKTEKYNSNEEFEKAFNKFQEYLKEKWNT